MRKYLYPLAIYLAGLAIILNFAFTNDYTFHSDPIQEYNTYLGIVETGHWTPGAPKDMPLLSRNLLASCLSTTLFPALIQRATGVDPLVVYKLWNCLFIAFLPVAIFLLARRFLTPGYACMASAFTMIQPYFLWSPRWARTNIALIFFTLAMVVILNYDTRKRYKIPALIGCAIGIVISHYGTAFVSIFAFGLSLVILGIWSATRKKLIRTILPISTTLLALLVVAGCWYGVFNFATRITEKGEGITSSPPLDTGKGFVEKGITEAISIPNTQGFFALERRELTVQAAFGKTLPFMNAAQRTEFTLTWLSIIALSLGLLWIIRKQRKEKGTDPTYLVMSLVSYFTILLCITLPVISFYYGISRVYQHSLCLLSTCFVIGGIKIGEWLRIKPYIVPLLILVLLFLCTTGGAHLILGVSRDEYSLANSLYRIIR